jgi:hypothetical protein
MTQRVDKDSLPLNQPRRTPSHPTKSHVVKTKVDGKEKIIRFGEQGASTAGKPKEGESDRMKAKRASFKSRHAKNIAKGPSSPAYWANKVKWADGGFVRTNYAAGDSVRVQPQNAALGAIARALQGTHDFVSKPFGYENPPVQMLSELIGLPATARTVERMSYGQPITNINKANVPLLPDDTADAAMTVAPLVGPLGRVAKKTGTAGARMVGEELNRAILDNSGPLAKFVPQAAKPLYVVPPQGNLNLTPMARSEILKGPEAQTPENFLNQLRGKPGMTQEGFDDLVKQYQGLEPNTRMTKAEFEQRIPPSQYNKVDLFDASVDTDAHWLTEAENMVRQDQSEIYENMLDRLGAKVNSNNVGLLQEYYNKNLTFEELSPDLKKALTRAEATTPDKMKALDDLYAEERENSINNTYEYIRERMQDEGSGYQGIQRLLENPDRSAEGYFELGVTHPEQTATYKHYSGYSGDEGGLIGHVRGTFIPADATDETRKLINPILSSDEVILAKPNSMVIEEIQSDAQKGVAQTGALRQAHGTMFKAAIQHALEGGADTVYYPTAKTIGGIRLKESSAYAPIYDQQIIKEGLKPLLKIPGVDSRKIGDAYYEINFTPEAKDFILKGEGQAAPGYAEGGSVMKTAAADLMKFLDAQGLTMSDVVAAFGKRGLPLSAAFYSGDLGKDEDLELRARRMQKPTITEAKYGDGGSVDADEQAAFGIYPSAGKRSQRSDIGDKLNASLVPQDALDLALTVLPYGKVGKTLAAAIVSGAPAEAQAGNMSSLLKLVAKEAPEQFHSIREALLRTFNTGLEHSVIGSTRMGGPSKVVQGVNDSVVPNKLDVVNARRNIDQSGLIDFHTHPRQNNSVSEFKITPSDADLQTWMSYYGGSRTATTPNEIKTMVGSPPSRQDGVTSAYNFFATNKPNQTLDRRAYDAARYELQRSKSLQSLKDIPEVRQYLDTGGTLGDVLSSASPMVLQKLYAQKGLGRHDMRLSNAPVAGPLGTENNLFDQIVNPSLEVLKAKRFAEGGSVSYDPTQVDHIMNSIGTPRLAEGGSVTAYDPSRVDAILNQFM